MTPAKLRIIRRIARMMVAEYRAAEQNKDKRKKSKARAVHEVQLK